MLISVDVGSSSCEFSGIRAEVGFINDLLFKRLTFYLTDVGIDSASRRLFFLYMLVVTELCNVNYRLCGIIVNEHFYEAKL